MATPVCTISRGGGSSTTDKPIHSIPCKLHYDGPAKISGYFITEEGPDARKTAAFRGHGLEGVTLSVPPGYEMCVLSKRSEGQNTFDVETRQKSFVLWEWDREAGKRSTTSRALSQLRIAQALAED
ncbi:hypothetical protein V3C99_012403 [Haemonchus contortus]